MGRDEMKINSSFITESVIYTLCIQYESKKNMG